MSDTSGFNWTELMFQAQALADNTRLMAYMEMDPEFAKWIHQFKGFEHWKPGQALPKDMVADFQDLKAWYLTSLIAQKAQDAG